MSNYLFFIDSTGLKDNTNIDKNVSDKLIKNLIKTAQNVYLQELLGRNLYLKLIDNYTNSTLTTKQSILIDDYIIDYLYAKCESLSVDVLIIKYADGVSRTTPNNTTQPSFDELKLIKINKEKEITMYEDLIKQYINDPLNIDSFPEYNSNTDNYVNPVKAKTYGIYFEDSDLDYEYNNRRAQNDQEQGI
jgi:hypothetical protein